MPLPNCSVRISKSTGKSGFINNVRPNFYEIGNQKAMTSIRGQIPQQKQIPDFFGFPLFKLLIGMFCGKLIVEQKLEKRFNLLSKDLTQRKIFSEFRKFQPIQMSIYPNN